MSESTARRRALTVLDSYGSLLVLLLANFFLLEVVDDPRWGALGSTLLAAAALIVAISDPATGDPSTAGRSLSIASASCSRRSSCSSTRSRSSASPTCCPAALLVTATLPVTLSRVLHHQRVTYETVLGALCSYVLLGAVRLRVPRARPLLDGPFFAQPGPHQESEYLYFSFVTLTTLGFGDLSPAVGLPQALTALEALLGQVFLVTLVARLVTLWVRQDDVPQPRCRTTRPPP